jgi:outer membrane protein
MKKSICWVILAAVLIFAWASVSLAADKICIVSLQKVMQGSNAGKKATEDFEKFREKKSQEIKNAEKELQKMKDDLEKQGSLMTPSSRSEKETAFQKKMRDYQLLVNDTNEELRKRDRETAEKIGPSIMKVVNAIAEREKCALMLDTTALLYYAKENDYTAKVIEEFNKTK